MRGVCIVLVVSAHAISQDFVHLPAAADITGAWVRLNKLLSDARTALLPNFRNIGRTLVGGATGRFTALPSA